MDEIVTKNNCYVGLRVKLRNDKSNRYSIGERKKFVFGIIVDIGNIHDTQLPDDPMVEVNWYHTNGKLAHETTHNARIEGGITPYELYIYDPVNIISIIDNLEKLEMRIKKKQKI